MRSGSCPSASRSTMRRSPEAARRERSGEDRSVLRRDHVLLEEARESAVRVEQVALLVGPVQAAPCAARRGRRSCLVGGSVPGARGPPPAPPASRGGARTPNAPSGPRDAGRCRRGRGRPRGAPGRWCVRRNPEHERGEARAGRPPRIGRPSRESLRGRPRRGRRPRPAPRARRSCPRSASAIEPARRGWRGGPRAPRRRAVEPGAPPRRRRGPTGRAAVRAGRRRKARYRSR